MASTDPPETRHRIKVRILVVLASILAFLAIFTSWIDRQALDTNQWVDTSGKLLEDKAISDAVATYSVDQLYANVDVAAVIKKRLPPDLQPFSAPWPPGSAQFATQAAQQAFQSPRIQQAWKDANRVAHTQLVSILKGNNEVVSSAERQGRPRPPPDRPPARQPDRAEEAGSSQNAAQPDVGPARDRRLARSSTPPGRSTKLIEGLAWFFTFGSAGPLRASRPIWRGAAAGWSCSPTASA